jgi:RNA polymerase sigma factor (sigma-70 family)
MAAGISPNARKFFWPACVYLVVWLRFERGPMTASREASGSIPPAGGNGMALTPSETVRFDSWKQLIQWLPEAGETELITVFVWACNQTRVPAVEQRQLAQVRKESFEYIVRRTKEPLTRFLTRRHNCRDSHTVEDVIQDIHLQLYRRADQFDPQRSFWGWLYSIARSKYIDTLRRIRPGEVGTGWTPGNDEALEQWFQKHARVVPAPDAAAIEQEEQQRLEAALSRLPKMQQTICRLKLDGVKGTEIAKQIGKSQAYVSQGKC